MFCEVTVTFDRQTRFNPRRLKTKPNGTSNFFREDEISISSTLGHEAEGNRRIHQNKSLYGCQHEDKFCSYYNQGTHKNELDLFQ